MERVRFARASFRSKRKKNTFSTFSPSTDALRPPRKGSGRAANGHRIVGPCACGAVSFLSRPSWTRLYRHWTQLTGFDRVLFQVSRFFCAARPTCWSGRFSSQKPFSTRFAVTTLVGVCVVTGFLPSFFFLRCETFLPGHASLCVDGRARFHHCPAYFFFYSWRASYRLFPVAFMIRTPQ